MKSSSGSGSRLGSIWERVNSSFWFIPAFLTFIGLLLSGITQWLDSKFQGLLDSLPAVVSGGATGASSVLSAISGSLITVIATVFSLTIVSLTLASGQYSPRLMRSFTSDRGLQVVLGSYIGTFVYSLLVLRIVALGGSGGAKSSFQPTISVGMAILLALVCVGLLIYFISHVSQIIQSSNIVQMAQLDMMGIVSNLENLDASTADIRDPEENPRWADLLAGESSMLKAESSGYVQSLDVDEVLKEVVDKRTQFVEIPSGPGIFVSAGLPLLRVWPAAEEEYDSRARREVHRAFVFGQERSFQQDIAFGFRQLSDIALKGLSPGINDPTTAMQAMDRMETVLIALGSKDLPSRVQEREINEHKVLVKVRYSTFEELVGLAFDQVRRAAFTSGQVAVLERLIEILDRAMRVNISAERQSSLWARIFTVARLCPQQISDPEDAVNLMLRAVESVYGLSMKQRVTINEDLDRLLELSEDLDDNGRIREAIEDARTKVR